MHQSPSPTRRPGTSADGFRAVTLSAALAALAALIPLRTDAQAQAPPQPPAPAHAAVSGANLEYPVLPIGSTLPDFTLPGVDGKTHKASEYSGQGAGHRLREQPLSGLAALRRPDREALRGLQEQGRHARRDQSEQSEDRAPRRARLHRRDRLAAGDEAAGAVPRHRLAVPLRRRHPGRLDEVRRRRHAAHLHLRRGAQAALPGTHRRQPARRAGEDPGRPQRARRAARRQAGAGCRDDGRSAAPRSGCRRRPASSRSGRESRPSRSPSTWSARRH